MKLILLLLIILPCLNACTSANRRMGLDDDLVIDTDLTVSDLKSAAQKMSRSIASSKISSKEKKNRIVFLKIENRTFDDTFDSYNLLSTIRKELMANNNFEFIDRKQFPEILKNMTGTEIEKQKKIAKLMNVDYFLTGRAFAHSIRKEGAREVYYRLSFRLTDAETSGIVWCDDYECKYFGKYEPINR